MLGLVLAVASCAALGAAGHRPGPLVSIEVAVYEGDPLGSKAAGTIQVVSRPRLVTQSGRPAFVQSGQDVTYTRPDGRTATEQAGVQVEFLPLMIRDGTVWVEMNAQVREVQFGSGVKAAGNAPAFTEQSARVTWVAVSGETVRHRIGARSPADQTWVEVTVRPVK